MRLASLPVLGLMLFLWCGVEPVRAGTFEVKPVRVEFSARLIRSSISVLNLGIEPSTIQTRLMLWKPDGIEESLADSDEVLINPPIFTLQPGQTQSVRVGLRRVPPDGVEGSYRVIFEEVPPPPKPGFQGVTNILRISIPIFVRPRAAKPQLVWTARRVSGNELAVSVENRGNIHIQIKSFGITGTGRPEPDYVNNKSAYVLPGGRKEWMVPDGRFNGSDQVVIDIRTDSSNAVTRQTVVLPSQ